MNNMRLTFKGILSNEGGMSKHVIIGFKFTNDIYIKIKDLPNPIIVNPIIKFGFHPAWNDSFNLKMIQFK